MVRVGRPAHVMKITVTSEILKGDGNKIGNTMAYVCYLTQIYTRLLFLNGNLISLTCKLVPCKKCMINHDGYIGECKKQAGIQMMKFKVNK